MKSQSLMTDHAMALAIACKEIVAPALREEEQREFFHLCFEAAKAAFESYEDQADRMRHRLKPSIN